MTIKKQFDNFLTDLIIQFAAKQDLVYLGHNSSDYTYRFKNSNFKFEFAFMDMVHDVVKDVTKGLILEWHLNYTDEQREVLTFQTFIKTKKI